MDFLWINSRKEIISSGMRSIHHYHNYINMTHYFIKEGKNEVGPFTMEQLKYRQLSKDTPVWFAGLEEWTTAGQVHELKEIFVSKSPSSLFSCIRLGKLWSRLFEKNYSKKTYQVVLKKNKNHLN
jgi:hypothetical protein